MKALRRCANSCEASPSPPSKVICRACMDKITATLEASQEKLRASKEARRRAEEDARSKQDGPNLYEERLKRVELERYALRAQVERLRAALDRIEYTTQEPVIRDMAQAALADAPEAKK